MDSVEESCMICWGPIEPCAHGCIVLRYTPGNNIPEDDFQQEYDYDHEPPYWP